MAKNDLLQVSFIVDYQEYIHLLWNTEASSADADNRWPWSCVCVCEHVSVSHTLLPKMTQGRRWRCPPPVPPYHQHAPRSTTRGERVTERRQAQCTQRRLQTPSSSAVERAHTLKGFLTDKSFDYVNAKPALPLLTCRAGPLPLC